MDFLHLYMPLIFFIQIGYNFLYSPNLQIFADTHTNLLFNSKINLGNNLEKNIFNQF